jgi:hypothetical protein
LACSQPVFGFNNNAEEGLHPNCKVSSTPFLSTLGIPVSPSNPPECAVRGCVALPFIKSDDGVAPGEAMECQSESQALTRAGAMSRKPANAGAIAFKRSGHPALGDFADAIVIKTFGEVPERLDEL